MTDQDNLREREHNHPTTNRFAFTGGTEMTSQDELRDFDELRDRIAYILETHQHMAIDQQACAIVNGLGLTVETHAATHSKRAMTRIISAWEWDNQ